MKRILPILALLLHATGAHAGSAPPLATLLTGTVADGLGYSVSGSTTSYCLVNFALPPGSPSFADNGPSVSYYQQDAAGSAITVAFPGLGHGTQITGRAPAWDFFAAGTAQLVFSGSFNGTVTFLTGGVWVPSSQITPLFSQFSASWNSATLLLTVNFLVTLGNCTVPFSAVYIE